MIEEIGPENGPCETYRAHRNAEISSKKGENRAWRRPKAAATLCFGRPKAAHPLFNGRAGISSKLKNQKSVKKQNLEFFEHPEIFRKPDFFETVGGQGCGCGADASTERLYNRTALIK